MERGQGSGWLTCRPSHGACVGAGKVPPSSHLGLAPAEGTARPGKDSTDKSPEPERTPITSPITAGVPPLRHLYLTHHPSARCDSRT